MTLVRPGGPDRHWTLRADARAASARTTALHGVHPEAAARIDLDRLRGFELERAAAPEALYCFHGRSRAEPGDERIFVLGDVRGRSPDDGREASLHVPVFERAFHEATRALRGILVERDPQRRLQWNRIAIYVGAEIFLDPSLVERLARRLAPATRHLGLEKVVVRLHLLDRATPERARARRRDRDLGPDRRRTWTIQWRAPRAQPLAPASDYERKVVEARRRRLVYPYEIVRMLTGAGATPGSGDARAAGRRFEEYDLDAASATPARDQRGRAPLRAEPERRRVRRDHARRPRRCPRACGACSCSRIRRAAWARSRRPSATASSPRSTWPSGCGVPVEWVPVSSGARIAMDSGTENLDATARVVRRIVTFTQAGGVIHVIVHGVNVGAQSYWDALATMLLHTRGVLIMTPDASMVLTGRAALEASGSVSAEDEVGDRRLRARHGAERRGAVLRARPRRRLPHPLRALPLHATSCRASARRARRTSSDPRERPVGDEPCEAGGGFETRRRDLRRREQPGPQAPVRDARADARGDRPRRRLPRALAAAGSAPRRRSSGTRTSAAARSA